MVINPYTYSLEDPDADLYFSQLTGTVSDQFKHDVKVLVHKLKKQNMWNKLDRLWLLATENQQNSTISLVNPLSTPLTEYNNPTWTANQGYTGNSGASSYIDTNYNCSIDGVAFQQDSGCLFMYSRTNLDGVVNDIGVVTQFPQNINCLTLRNSNLMDPYLNSPSQNTQIPCTDSRGFFVCNRNSPTLIEVYKNGTLFGSTPGNSTAVPFLNNFLLCINYLGNPGFYSDRQLAVAGFGGGDLNQTLFNAAIQEFAVARGFNI
jgi:hypothetical protein